MKVTESDPLPGGTEVQPRNAEAWARTCRILASAVRRHCPSDLSSMREDLVQIAILKLVENRAHEENSEPRASYLRKIAFTVVIDELRRRKRGAAYRQQAVNLELETVSPEVGLAIRQCLQRLSADRRVVVALYLQGSRLAETARALGWVEKRAENLLYRGLQELRLCLGPGGLA
jgi:RNA polymerase sigma-70 factor (ECF subfamily)